MVVVNVQQRHPAHPTVAQMLGCNRRVIQKTIATKEVCPGMVARWTRQHKRAAGA